MGLLDIIIPKWKRGKKNNLKNLPISNGNVLVTTDTEELYIDIDGKRLNIGKNNIIQLTQEEYDALPDTKYTDNKAYFIDDGNDENTIADATNVGYDNTESGLEANNVQEAIDEVNTNLGGFSFYPQKLTQAQYDALPAETKATQGQIFVVVKE